MIIFAPHQMNIILIATLPCHCCFGNNFAIRDRRVGQKARPLCFTACNFRNIDKICIKFDNNQRNFILNIKS